MWKRSSAGSRDARSLMKKGGAAVGAVAAASVVELAEDDSGAGDMPGVSPAFAETAAALCSARCSARIRFARSTSRQSPRSRISASHTRQSPRSPDIPEAAELRRTAHGCSACMPRGSDRRVSEDGKRRGGLRLHGGAGRRRGREIRERGKDSGAWASQGQRAGGLTGLEDC